MSDQFAEWDKFYAWYEKTYRPTKAMKGYKRERLKATRKAAAKKAAETRARKRAEAKPV